MRIRSQFSFTFAAVAVAALAGCAGEAEETVEAASLALVEGQCGDVYGGDVCTWAELDGDRVVSFGANVPMTSIEGAPADAEMAWPPLDAGTLAFPSAVTAQWGTHNLKIYWEAHGHPPGPYLVPHFDFHMYTVDAATTDAIDCSDTSKPMSPPAGYALPDIDIPEIGFLAGLCVPAMGMHALLQSELESEDPFSGTMVIGYYEQDPIFYEPMITRDMLMERRTFTLDMPAVAGVGEGVTIPGHFEAQFDADNDAYRFVFSDIGAM
jgi:hypothetical protein